MEWSPHGECMSYFSCLGVRKEVTEEYVEEVQEDGRKQFEKQRTQEFASRY